MTFSLRQHAYDWARRYGHAPDGQDIEDVAAAYADEYVRNFENVPDEELPPHPRFFAFWLTMTTIPEERP